MTEVRDWPEASACRRRDLVQWRVRRQAASIRRAARSFGTLPEHWGAGATKGAESGAAGREKGQGREKQRRK
jgi:hypothetical protein